MKISDEERQRRIYRVIELAKEGMSAREIAKYLSENEFQISNVTVSSYIQAFQKLNPVEYKQLQEKINSHKPKTIKNDEIVKQRVKKVVELLLKNYTFDEIAMILNEKPMTVYRDFKSRVTQYKTEEELKENLGISVYEIDLINQMLQERKNSNLKK